MDISLAELLLMLLVGMGPFKAMLVFVEKTEHYEQRARDKVAVLAMGLIDLLVLLVAGRVGTLIPHPVIGLLEKLFSILVAALAVQIMVEGALELGII